MMAKKTVKQGAFMINCLSKQDVLKARARRLETSIRSLESAQRWSDTLKRLWASVGVTDLGAKAEEFRLELEEVNRTLAEVNTCT